ncbi:MAG: DNA starvation/stationary phase protection protein [Lachnospiraceae bacterium]|nr:DNA starvation/stationary phase protection protein [Lachnospiraceae bacterium]
MEKQLNKFLADLVVMYHKLQHFHWYVKGGDFFQVHAKLEEYYDEINEDVDDVAEVMLQCKFKPVSTMKEFVKLSSITEPKSGFVSSATVLKAVLADYKHLLDSAKSIKTAADKAGNFLVSAKADDYIEQFSKVIWMLGQTV